MAVGFPIGKSDIDNKAGSLAVGVRDALDRCKQFCDLLNNTNIIPNDSFLTGLGYSGSEVTILRAAFTDLKALYTVSHAGATVPAVNDFFFNAQKLTGVVLL